MYLGNILEHPVFIVPTDPKAVAELLDKFADDWLEALTFVANYGKSIGASIDEDAVSKLMKEKYE